MVNLSGAFLTKSLTLRDFNFPLIHSAGRSLGIATGYTKQSNQECLELIHYGPRLATGMAVVWQCSQNPKIWLILLGFRGIYGAF